MNPLLDSDFLISLFESKEREIFIRLIALTFQEEPIELIEGKATAGNVNIDGNSSVRRTCSLTLVSEELNINEYYWGLKSKFKLEIGLKNNINSIYEDIIWFPQGIFIITDFKTALSTNNYTINISGRDKMCLLNGDLGGSLTASIDFGVEEYVDLENNTTTYTHIPIEKIIREALHIYANEPYHNIIINDLDEAAVELLEYRGNVPLYLLYEINRGQYINYTLNGDQECFIGEQKIPATFATIEENGGAYDPRVEIAPEIDKEGSIIYLKQDSEIKYQIAKVTYGQTAGYRATELTYAGELVSKIGESLTSIFDKIVKMLGNYEYFYDLEGKFIFQKKRNYLTTSWNNIVKTEDDQYAENMVFSSDIIYNFQNNNLITSFSNAPKLNNLKNDYSIWGNRKTVTDVDVPIHYRYAIDIKPKKYTSIKVTEEEAENYNNIHKTKMKAQESKTYTSEEYDWREIIYQMAMDYYSYNQLDDFISKIIEANRKDELYSTGLTGYEQYYVDLQGFWRELYYPEAPSKYLNYNALTVSDIFKYDEALYVKNYYEKADGTENREDLLALVSINGVNELQPLLDAIKINYYDSFDVETGQSNTFYIPGKNGMIPIPLKKRDMVKKGEIYIRNDNGEYLKLLESINYKDYQLYKYIESDEYKEITSIDPQLVSLYYNATTQDYYKYLYQSYLNIEGNPREELNPKQISINYYNKGYDYIQDDSDKKYWTNKIIDSPSLLNFWFDFLDAESELGQFSIKAIGDRAKVVNDKEVTAIYFREVPDLIFTTQEEYKNIVDKYEGYLPVFIQSNLESLFNISSQGKSAKDLLDELLYEHSYCSESVTISALPVYHLQPNYRISIKDEISKINGDYIISRINIPLTYNGTMSITATKAPQSIY